MEPPSSRKEKMALDMFLELISDSESEAASTTTKRDLEQPEQGAEKDKDSLPPGWETDTFSNGLRFYVHRESGLYSLTFPFLLDEFTETAEQESEEKRDVSKEPSIRYLNLTDLQKFPQPAYKSDYGFINCLIPGHVDEAMGVKELRIFVQDRFFEDILEEYAVCTMDARPNYGYDVILRARLPFEATVRLNDVIYATAYGSNAIDATEEAALTALQVLIPNFSDIVEDKIQSQSADVMEVFDLVRVEDPIVNMLCEFTCQLSPYQILLECVERNRIVDDPSDLVCCTQLVNSKEINFVMHAGKYSAKIKCKSKREGRQKAAQALLQMIHPTVFSWGSLLRLYGNTSRKAYLELQKSEDVQACVSIRANLKRHLKSLALGYGWDESSSDSSVAISSSSKRSKISDSTKSCSSISGISSLPSQAASSPLKAVSERDQVEGDSPLRDPSPPDTQLVMDRYFRKVASPNGTTQYFF